MSAFQRVQLKEVVRDIETWNPLKAGTDETFHYIDLSAVDQDSKRIIGAREISCGDAPSRARQLVKQDDVLVATVRPNLNGVAIVPPELHEATASTGFCVVRPDPEKLAPNYLFHWVKTEAFVSAMVKQATGASYPAVSDKIVLGSSIPLPSLPEQRRIASILDKADSLRAKRREALVHLESLSQSIFIEMFGDPVSNPLGLEKVALASVSEIATGSTPSRASGEYYGGSIPWVKTTEVLGKPIFDTEEKLTDAGFKAMRGKLHPVDSIVVAMYGQGQTRGRCGLLKIAASCNQACGVIKPSRKFNSLFMFQQLQMAYEQLRALGRGGNQENLNLQLLGGFEVLLPSLTMQNNFVKRLEVINKAMSSQRDAHFKCDALFSTLQHSAFRGEL